MTQYRDTRPASTETPRPRPVPQRDLQNQVRQMREQIEIQQQTIQRLERDLRRMREQINQHAQTINRINRG